MSEQRLQPKGLTFSAIFKAMSLNYGESVGNISELKKLSIGGEYYSYMSRQALRYDIFRTMREVFAVDAGKEEPLHADADVVQFKPEVKISDYVEADLFGYMKTESGQGALTRSAVARISPAVSLEPWLMDVEFGANHDFARRAGSSPNPFQFEHHLSLYSYTLTVGLDRVGEDENDNISLSAEEKAERVNVLLDVVQILTRNIKGRMENLSPVFAIGGVYDVKNPFFLGRLEVSKDKNTNRYNLNTEILEGTLGLRFLDREVKQNTYMGLVKGFWGNESEIKALLDEDKVKDISGFFEKLKEEVTAYYGVTQ